MMPTMQEIDNWRSALAPLAPEYRLYVDLLHAAALIRKLADENDKLARRMWNEALEEAAKACEDATTYDEDDPGSGYAEIVRALKLPEE